MLTRRVVLSGGLAGLALAWPAFSRQMKGRDVIRLPIEVTDSGLVVIGATIDCRRLRFLVDTGAEVSAIRRDLVGPLHLMRIGRRPLVGADARLVLADYEAHGVVFGGALTEPGVRLSAIPAPGPYDGLMSCGFLTRSPSVLDYGAREIRLYPGGRLDLTGYAMIHARVARRLDLAPRFLCPVSIDGLALSAMLDTGFETELFLNAGIVRRHGLWDRFAVHEEKTFHGMAGKRLVTRVVDMPDLRLSNIGRRSVRVTLADPAGSGIPAIGADAAIIGASLLRHFAIAFAGGDLLGFRSV